MSLYSTEDIMKETRESHEAAQNRRVKKDRGAGAAENQDSSAKKHFEIDIFRGWCKSCGICAAFCPRQCIRLDADGTPSVADSSRCSGCGWCELHCPDFAISVRESGPESRKQEV